MSLLNENDVKRIKSKSLYWNEISKREGSNLIAFQEVLSEVRELGFFKVLSILTQYAEMNISKEKSV